MKKKMDKTFLLIILMGAILASSIIAVNFFLFRGSENLFPVINLIAALIFAFPIIMLKYAQYGKSKEIESMFPVFLRDFVESVRGGMPIPQALQSLTGNDYKAMNYYVRKMAAQTDWGIPVDKVLLKFSSEVNSKLIGRVISSVIESHRFGGNLADTFEALTNTSFEVEKLKTERKLYLQSQMITGYIVFFVFLAVMIGLGRFIIPTMTQSGMSAGQMGLSTSQPAQEAMAREFKDIFRNLIIVQGFFAGLCVGKMSEGALVGGIKHSLIMILVGVMTFTLMG